MSIESAIAQIHKEGLLVLNLFELGAGKWQANLYDGKKAWSFGVSFDPEASLLGALKAARKEPGTKLIENKVENIENLLDDLFS